MISQQRGSQRVSNNFPQQGVRPSRLLGQQCVLLLSKVPDLHIRDHNKSPNQQKLQDVSGHI
ncbi:hypothetical protein Scep_029735 [Stephania cephalantha]|uniref:Uncharacterized protein n=1 Tax=Stephania cephalantha TaxID=152367 RepID=A0AAP0HDS2_9MAGN